MHVVGGCIKHHKCQLKYGFPSAIGLTNKNNVSKHLCYLVRSLFLACINSFFKKIIIICYSYIVLHFLDYLTSLDFVPVKCKEITPKNNFILFLTKLKLVPLIS